MTDNKLEIEVGKQKILIEIDKLAEQADGSVLITAGGTVILITAVVAKKNEGVKDFFPLIVDYEERLYAAGKIKGSRWVKREGRPTDDAILTARVVDRSIRPLFPKKFLNDLQVIITVLSYDEENNPDILSIIGASAALIRAGLPFSGPIAAVRIGKFNGQFVVNPTHQEMENSELNLIISASKDKVVMIEADGLEISEADILEAIKLAFNACQSIIEAQKSIDKKEIIFIDSLADDQTVANYEETEKAVTEFINDKIQAVLAEASRTSALKATREANLNQLQAEVIAHFIEGHGEKSLIAAFEKLIEKNVRKAIIYQDQRPDGRALDEIRPLSAQVGLLPRTHGSGLFTRGSTQCLTIATLGAPGEVQMIETMEEEGEKRFIHHYNFPPFSTGEVKPIRGASRREIGHGALAERALIRMIPQREDFPYTIRLVSEILSSNGSSSMAATCGSTLALMDAGVPIKKPIAGIAMGLMTDPENPERYKILTDIQGIEDFSGDMDFKVTGSDQGITAIQMDTKISGLDFSIIEQALEAAKKARLKILELIKNTIPESRQQLSEYAPRISALKIDPAKIGDIIGPGGKMINKIIEESGGKEFVSIDIDDDGTVMVSSTNSEMAEKAIKYIQDITLDVELNQTYEGQVVQIVVDRNSGKEIGAIVQILPNREGMVHISEISQERIAKISDKIKIGQTVKVKVIGIDKERGRTQLSIKAIGQQS